jgi:hypothetical protein
MVSFTEAIIASVASGFAAVTMCHNLWAACLISCVVWFAIRSVHRKIEEMSQNKN